MKTSLVTIIIPTYNEKDNIPLILTKIINLNTNFNILVVDDNSPDGTSEIVEKIMLSNSNSGFLGS